MESSQGTLQVDAMVTGLDQPWAFAFLPNNEGILITERGGRLLIGANGRLRNVRNVPPVYVEAQGGLLDVLVPRDFAQSREIFLTHSVRHDGAHATALSRAELNINSRRLENVTRIFTMKSDARGGRHFGSRLVETRDGYLYMTMGDRGDRPSAQDRTNHNGTVIRLNRDGSVPNDNPYIGHESYLPEIWSFGHRNPQGAALDLQGRLWVNEHGAAGGDEVNLVRRGANYGWPVIAYGTHYSGAKIGEGTSKAGMEQPKHYWDPSIAPSGMMIYSGKLWPEWRGDHFIGSLKFAYISRLDPGTWQEERLESFETGRVRDVREAPDGTIWFLSITEGTLFRMSPGR